MIRFSKYILLYFAISACILLPGIYSLVRFGFKPSVDFTGGTLLEISSKKNLDRSVFDKISSDTKLPLISQTDTGKSYILRFKSSSDTQISGYVSALEKTPAGKITLVRQETVGPVLGQELLSKAIIAAIVAMFGIFSYVAYAFKDFKFGMSAIIALIHDILVVFGTFSILGALAGVEVDTLFVTAFLTTMSFSVHDTIVIFDRIREYRRRDTKTPFDALSDRALTETMGRSLVNSFTIIFMLLALVLMGGETVRWFAVALLIGTITGTYSSPFVATPIVLLWDRWEKRKIHSGSR